ncbi:hypothetical protein V8F20_008561 [Naviculisporaceae sp. PSN 640]
MPQPYFTNTHFNGLKVGEVFPITWSGGSGPVTITLKEGTPRCLRTVYVIAERIEGNSLLWVPVKSGRYALEIKAVGSYRTKYSSFFVVEDADSRSTSSSGSPILTPISNTSSDSLAVDFTSMNLAGDQEVNRDASNRRNLIPQDSSISDATPPADPSPTVQSSAPRSVSFSKVSKLEDA